ncbi:MAG: ABC transporter permease [Dehalococcoidia bacterium]|nr:ABC transporter permease [Dehalococcoidia bacterium]
MQEILTRLGRHSLLRGASLLLTVLIAIYLTVVIANWGGAMDDARRAQIRFDVTQQIYANPEYFQLPQSELQRLVDERSEAQIRIEGLDRPFIERSLRYTRNAITLNLGRSEHIMGDTGSRMVRNILLDRLPSTLLLIATAELLLFFLALFGALFLSRRYGSFLDRLTIGLAPTSAAPAWFYGLFLILIFAAVLRVLPWGGMTEAPPPRDTLGYALSLLRHLILPVSAVIIGAIFSSIYSWRTFFLMYSSEDYVELAKAKGLSSRAIERRYILRPTMPPILTSFLLMLITMWMGAIVLETVFNWPGIGRLYYQAIQVYDTPIIVGVVVIFGYLLAVTVFLLDFMYAALDPRVRLSMGGGRR